MECEFCKESEGGGSVCGFNVFLSFSTLWLKRKIGKQVHWIQVTKSNLNTKNFLVSCGIHL